MADTMHKDPKSLANEVRETQDAIGRTVDKIEEKMTPHEISRSVMGEEGTDVAKEALEVARTNPVPVAMIAVGLIWLVASSNSPAIRRFMDRITGHRDGHMDLRSRSEEPAPIGPDPASGHASSGDSDMDLRPRSAEPAPIGPPPPAGEHLDRRF